MYTSQGKCTPASLLAYSSSSLLLLLVSTAGLLCLASSQPHLFFAYSDISLHSPLRHLVQSIPLSHHNTPQPFRKKIILPNSPLVALISKVAKVLITHWTPHRASSFPTTPFIFSLFLYPFGASSSTDILLPMAQDVSNPKPKNGTWVMLSCTPSTAIYKSCFCLP